MNLKAVLLISIFSGLLALFIIKKHIDNQNQKLNQAYKPIRIVVAGKNLKSGEKISYDNIAARKFPSNFINDDMILENEASLLEGLKLKTDIKSGEVILKKQLTGDSDKQLGFSVHQNLRLIPLKNDIIGFLPDNLKDRERVDILFTAKNGNNADYTKTIIQNIELRKIRNSLNPDQDYVKAHNMFSYFLILSPVQSEIYTHASMKGQLSLVIRNPEDSGIDIIPQVNDTNFMLGEKSIKRRKMTNSIEIIKTSIDK